MKPTERNDTLFLSPCNNHGAVLKLHIQPGASKNEISGIHGDRLKIKLLSPPVEGAANKALIDFLAFLLNIKKKEVVITQGMRSREKTVKIEGISFGLLKSKLSEIIEIKKG